MKIEFPRKLKRQGHSFKLVLLRQIPKREAAAIYIGPLVLNRGKLQQDYLVMGISRGELKELECCADLNTALKVLCLSQPKLYVLNAIPSQKKMRSAG